jgi:glutathione peroxidase
MLKKYYFLVYTVVIMFSLFSKAEGKYQKLFFELSIKDINGNELSFSEYRNKTILLVNVASKCGFTKQYSGLQTLYEKYQDSGFVIIGIPSRQ